MKYVVQVAVALIIMATVGCSTHKGNYAMAQTKSETPSKERVKQTFPVGAFDRITCQGVADVEFEQSDKTGVVVNAPSNYLPFVQVTCEGGLLKIDTRQIGKRRVGKGIRVKVSGPHLTVLCHGGVGNFKAEKTVTGDAFSIRHTGVGDLFFNDLRCNRLTLDCSAVGDVRLAGKTGEAVYKTSGVGTVNARKMLAEKVSFRHSGVGDLECFSSGTIDIKVNGIGDVRYYGRPKVIGLEKKGIGTLEAK